MRTGAYGGEEDRFWLARLGIAARAMLMRAASEKFVERRVDQECAARVWLGRMCFLRHVLAPNTRRNRGYRTNCHYLVNNLVNMRKSPPIGV